jgi:hypothetical protein
MSCVVKTWIQERCSWKEQTVLLCALRGPDAGGTPELKAWTRWLRNIILENAAPKKTFMREDWCPSFYKIAEDKPLALDMLPVHYLTHLMHAFQVVWVRHPLTKEALVARAQYEALVAFLHLEPELEDEMICRLSDEVEETS